jgi:hypothetical protein
MAPAMAADNAINWSEPIPLALGYYNGLLADHNDVFHAVSSGGPLAGSPGSYTLSQNLESNFCSFCADVIYRRSVDGRNWTVPANLTNSHKGADKVEIWESQSQRIYINWDSGFDWYVGRGAPEDVRLIYSDDGGETWSDPVIISDADNQFQNPMQGQFTELGDGSLLAVWRFSTGPDQSIYSQLSNDAGLTWTEPEAIPGVLARDTNETPLDDYELVTDKLGNAHLFAVVNTTYAERSSLVEIEFRQGQWRPEQIVYEASPERVPEWPQAKIGPQNDIHLTWFVRVRSVQTPPAVKPGDVPLEVYYAHRSGTMPEQPTQAFSPTQTPLPTIAIAAPLEPTATPYPTVVPGGDANVAPTTSDIYASRTVLLAVAVSALFCAGVAIAYRFGRR